MQAADIPDEATQIALLAALLEPAAYPEDDLRSALRRARGDLSLAAEDLLLPRVKSAGKRKAGTSLESWLGKKHGAPARSPRRDETEEASSPVSGLGGFSVAVPEPLKDGEADPQGAKSTVGPVGPKQDAFQLLKSASTPAAKPKTAPQPALNLATQASIDKHGLPLTLLSTPFSPAFASALFLAMMQESEEWDRHRWYLAGRWVESPHTSANYYRPGGGYAHDPASRERAEKGPGDGADGEAGKNRVAQYYYSGSELAPAKPFPSLLAEASELVEKAVNAALATHPRYPLEYAGPWRANMCGVNRYDGASSGVGWHADQLTYLGPYATIASVSLGTPRAFRLRETDTVDPAFKHAPGSKAIRTYEVTLAHGSLVLMNGGCQERYKHTVPPQKALDLFRPGWDIEQNPIPVDEVKTYTSRINITFRFFREDFHPLPGAGPYGLRQGTPHCKCGIPTLLRADQKAKARSKLSISPRKHNPIAQKSNVGTEVKPVIGIVDDDMVFFWQCQSPGNTGDMKGCGFFRILDMKAEGRGPCMIDVG